MKKRLLALNLAFVLLLTLVPSVALADGPVVLVPDKDGNASAEYYVNEGSDLTTEFTFIPSKSGVYRLFIEQPQAQPVSGESLALYRSGDNAESISMALNENDVDTRCVLEAGTEYTFSIENNQPGQHLIRLWFIDEAEYVEPVEISSANFPDDVFRQFVASYDINQNGLLEADEFAAINSLYICSSQSFPIQSLNGIEKFIYTKHISIDTDYSVDSDSSIKELPALPNGIESLNIRAGYLEKLPDLSVYTNLRFFNCSCNQITSLPSLPNGLQELDCSVNQITEWPELPDSLYWLDCSSNQLAMLPELPNGLEYLACSFNGLTSLPTLPGGLQELDCSVNQITEWPKLPESLYKLECRGCQLTSLPTLPGGLHELHCSGNQITEWPELPDSLFRLYCSNNQLTMLPDLPNGLEYLDCSYNELTSLPALPDGLQELNCCDNPLAEFPTLPDNLTTIGDWAFSSCSSLTSVTIPDGVTEIGDSAFYDCRSLTSVKIPNGVTEIGVSAFENCTSLQSIVLPNGVEKLNAELFNGCSSLKSVTLPANIESIGSTSFKGCTGLETITIPDNVKTIEKSAFFGCSSLKTVNLPVSVTLIDERAFEYCGSISTVNYAGTLAQWKAINFTYYNEALKKCKSINIKDHEHSYANGVCSGCGATDPNAGQTTPPEPGHTHNYTASVVKPNCTTAGYTVYTCAGCGSSYKDAYTSALGHDYKNGACTRCSATDPNYTKPSEPGHTHSYTTKVVDPTCTEQGYTLHTCSGCGNSYKDTYVAAKGHKYLFGECRVCGAPDPNYESIIPSIPSHTHEFKAVVTEPTCTGMGYTTNTCDGCGFSYKSSFKMATGHKIELQNAKAATCTTAGYSGDEYCTVCKQVVEKGTEIKALGHTTELQNVKAATCTAPGYSGDKYCTVCKQTVEKGTEVKALGHNYVGGVCSTCGATNSMRNPFKDVDKTTHADYYDAILWAYYNDITKGTNAAGDMFSPELGCTRAQIVTFLWRQSGAPVVEVANPFADVDKVKHADYYNAILWGYSTGVIKGVSDTEFDPDRICTRAEIVTMLYRLDGENAVKTGTQFTDLTQNWYKDAIAWAVAEKITKGTSDTTFTPDAPCTRAQAVTFLYRYFA